MKRCQRREFLSKDRKEVLEKEFQKNVYITPERKTELAVQLGMSEKQVGKWFASRRYKERCVRKAKRESLGDLKSTSEEEGSNASSLEPKFTKESLLNDVVVTRYFGKFLQTSDESDKDESYNAKDQPSTSQGIISASTGSPNDRMVSSGGDGTSASTSATDNNLPSLAEK
ncbi:uncharacterized protein LOC143460148 [Clavelina lepadiformis]|uniref:Homeobox domain-containing protein n=1 Tax=Clavelina lepadiformis TaxID=159417 RepID=A0ABP0FMP1_CLALP